MVTEQLGDEQILVIRIGKQDIRVAGVDPDLTLATGSQIEASAAIENLHVFDTQADGAAIGGRAKAS
jgi:ABC-type sugar transport system ATPase subunit